MRIVVNIDNQNSDYSIKDLYRLQDCIHEADRIARWIGTRSCGTIQMNEETKTSKPLYIELSIDTEETDKLLKEIEELGTELSKKIKEYEKQITYKILPHLNEIDAEND